MAWSFRLSRFRIKGLNVRFETTRRPGGCSVYLGAVVNPERETLNPEPYKAYKGILSFRWLHDVRQSEVFLGRCTTAVSR